MESCCQDVWAVLSISAPEGTPCPSVEEKKGANESYTTRPNMPPRESLWPQVTIRMHPSSIPDTRNFRLVNQSPCLASLLQLRALSTNACVLSVYGYGWIS